MSVYIHHKPYMSPLFCDNITITFNPDKSFHKNIIHRIEVLCEDGHGSDTLGHGFFCKIAKGGYKYAAYLSVSDDIGDIKGRLEIRCDPFYEGNRFIRLKWNPSYMSCSIARWFIDGFLQGCGGYGVLMKESKFTEFHLTVDVSNADLNCYNIHYPSIKYSEPKLNNGTWETYYLGKKESSKHFCIYDKVKQAKQWNNKHHSHKIDVPKQPTMRVEVVLRDITAICLPGIKNPFSKLCMSQLPKPIKPEPWFPMFARVAQIDGTQDALLLIQQEKDRKRLKRILEMAATDWWQPVDMWETQWEELAESIISPKYYSYPMPNP